MVFITENSYASGAKRKTKCKVCREKNKRSLGCFATKACVFKKAIIVKEIGAIEETLLALF